MSIKSKTGPKVFLFIIMASILIDHFFNVPLINTIAKTFLQWIPVISALGTLLGFVTLVKYNIRSIQSKESGLWQYNVIGLIVMAIWCIVGFGFGVKHEIWQWLYNSIISPLNMAFYGVLAFYIAGLAYRITRINSIEMLLFAFGMGMTLMTRAPVGEAIWASFPVIGTWINTVPSTAAQRGILMSGALGAIMISLRVMIGRERGITIE